MNREHSGIVFNRHWKKITAGLLFLFAGLLIGPHCYSQTYFYFETKGGGPGDTVTNFYTFLTIQNEGTATARVLYADSLTGESHLLEVTLTDSSVSNNNTGDVYLVPAGAAQLLAGNDDRRFLLPRFILKQQSADNEVFYSPTAVEYKGKDGNWRTGEMQINEQKKFVDLSVDRELVMRFFNDSDDFYRSLFFTKSRGNSPARKEKIYLIAVANTKDSSIGVTTKIDLDNITSTFTQLAAGLDASIITTSISGDVFGKRAVEAAINKLSPGPADIVVFYYSGHGFRYSNDVSKYPRMSLRKSRDQDIDLNNLKVEDVYNRILRKGARVNIVLADCCNDNIGSVAPVGRQPLRMRGAPRGGGPELNMENCNALFFPDHKVSILSTAAEANQLATGNPQYGGFFTSYFKIFLDKSLYGYESSPSWIKLLTDAREKAARQALTALCGTDRCVQRAEISVTPLQ